MQNHIKALGILTSDQYLQSSLGMNFARHLYSEKLNRHSTGLGQNIITTLYLS